MCVHNIYTHIYNTYMCLLICLSLSLYIHICIYLYIYIEREREIDLFISADPLGGQKASEVVLARSPTPPTRSPKRKFTGGVLLTEIFKQYFSQGALQGALINIP